jgi:hypothetical protein
MLRSGKVYVPCDFGIRIAMLRSSMGILQVTTPEENAKKRMTTTNKVQPGANTRDIESRLRHKSVNVAYSFVYSFVASHRMYVMAGCNEAASAVSHQAHPIQTLQNLT